MQFKAIIFDLDGTLLDTLEDLAESMNSVLLKAGFNTYPVESYKYFVGGGMETLVERTLPEGLKTGGRIKEFLNLMREEYGKRWSNKTHPYNGIPELLDELENRDLKKAVLSNKPDDFTKAVVSKLLPEWKFDVVRGQKKGVRKNPIRPGL